MHVFKKVPKRIYIEITESWGDGGACSTIKISKRQWTKILNGEKFDISANSYYEGEKSIVDWCFEDGKLSISGEDWTCLIDEMDVIVEKTAMLTTPKRSMLTSYFHLTKIAI